MMMDLLTPLIMRLQSLRRLRPLLQRSRPWMVVTAGRANEMEILERDTQLRISNKATECARRLHAATRACAVILTDLALKSTAVRGRTSGKQSQMTRPWYARKIIAMMMVWQSLDAASRKVWWWEVIITASLVRMHHSIRFFPIMGFLMCVSCVADLTLI